MNIIYFLILIIIASISSLKEYDKETVVLSDKTFEVENVNNYFTCNEKKIFQNMVMSFHIYDEKYTCYMKNLKIKFNYHWFNATTQSTYHKVTTGNNQLTYHQHKLVLLV